MTTWYSGVNLRKIRKYIIKKDEHEETLKSLLQNQLQNTNPKANSTTSCKGWSNAEDVFRTQETGIVARVLRKDPP